MTGATGSVGFASIEYLCQQGIHVIGLARPSSDLDLVNKLRGFGAEIILGDILDPNTYTNYFSKVNVIVHTAAVIRAKENEQYKSVNISGTKHIRDLAIKNQIKRFIHISTCGVYGITKNELTFETASTNPLSPYTQSKLESELILMEKIKELNLTIVRPPFIIGNHDRYVVPTLVKYFGIKVVPKFFKNDPLIGFVHAQDIAKCVFEMGIRDDSPHIVYNIQSFVLKFTRVVRLVHELQHKRTYFIPIPFTILLILSIPIDFLRKLLRKSRILANIRRIRTDWIFSSKRLHDDFNWTPAYSSKDLEILISNQLINKYE